jgi:hypothetical protein
MSGAGGNPSLGATARLAPVGGAGDFSIDVRRRGATHVVEVGGSMSVLGAALLGSRLLALLNDGAQRVMLDLEVAAAPAPGALLATLLRVDHYAAHRGARVVTVAGPGSQPALRTNSARRLLTVTRSRGEAIERLERESGPALSGSRRGTPRAG